MHPSLLAGKKENVPQFTVPSINFRRSQDDSYSVLVRNLQQQFAEEKQSKEALKEKETEPENQHCLVNYSLDESHVSNNSLNNSYNMVIPPSEIQPIIQKMAEYVAKNGEDFEYVVKSKNDKRFEFLQPSSEYYAYYTYLRDQSKLQLQPPSVSIDDSSVSKSEDLKSSDVNISNSTNVPSVQEASIIDEFEALYSHDSQDLVYGPELQSLVAPVDELSNSADSLDSLGAPKDSKLKCSKALKGPISFSLKAKESDAVPTEKLKIPLLLDDSDEESNDEGKREKTENPKRKRSEDIKSVPSSRHDSIEREEKPKLTSEMEAKLAEERIKDKLMSAVRERIVQQKKEKRLEMERQKREEQLRKEKQLHIEQQRKEKQLQLERKKKAALFLKMLKNRNPDLDLSKSDKQSDGSREFWDTADNGVLFRKIKGISTNNHSTVIPGIKSEWSESSASEESGEEIMITEFCSDPTAVPPVDSSKISAEPEQQPNSRHENKKRRKKQTRSKSQERHYKSSRNRDSRRRSRSPRNYKHERSKKEKELPAAYALVNRSRSRSRSPRRYRQNPGYWNRRR